MNINGLWVYTYTIESYIFLIKIFRSCFQFYNRKIGSIEFLNGNSFERKILNGFA